jgi:predicted nucleic acid-binding protein
MKGVDTKVLVRYITRDDPGQERAASRFLDSARTRSEPIFVNVIVLCDLVSCTSDFGTIELHHHACAPKTPFDLHRKTGRYLRLEFARAVGELTRRVALGWS